MKKILCFISLFFWGMLSAQTLAQPGRTQIYVVGGGGVHTQGASALSMQKGIYSGAAGFSHSFSDYAAWGLEMTFGRTDGKGEGLAASDVPSGTLAQQQDNYLTHWSVGATGRLYINPKSNWRFYVPVSIGYMNVTQKTKYEYVLDPDIFPPFIEWSQSHQEKAKKGDGLYVYAGLGTEYLLSAGLSVLAEVRLQTFKCGGIWVHTVQALAGASVRF